MSEPQTNSIVNKPLDRAAFEELYDGKAPWDIDKPQRTIAAVADRVTGRVLDAGCGTGEHALFLAARGHRVTGIDFVEEAVRRARAKAAGRGLAVEFLVEDATALADWSERFRSVIDSGLFHCLSDPDRQRYVRGLAQVLEPGGRLFLLCFSDEEPGTGGPRRVSRQELYDAFASGWEVESIDPIQFDTNPQAAEMNFSEGGPKGWLAVVRRSG
jgi:SAM-dependent methyltransferase